MLAAQRPSNLIRATGESIWVPENLKAALPSSSNSFTFAASLTTLLDSLESKHFRAVGGRKPSLAAPATLGGRKQSRQGCWGPLESQRLAVSLIRGAVQPKP